MNNTHTKAFNTIVGKSDKSNNKHVMLDVNMFVRDMSMEQFREIRARVKTANGYGSRDPITLNEIYNYCKKHNIEADSPQKRINFEEKPEVIDYKSFSQFDDIKIGKREGFVKSNDTENKVITIMFHDDSEIVEIKY